MKGHGDKGVDFSSCVNVIPDVSGARLKVFQPKIRQESNMLTGCS